MGAAAVAEKRKILVVDDIELNRTLTMAVLRGATYEVDSAADGATALAALDHKSYDLVLMDLEMPGLGGYDAALAIQRLNKGALKLAALTSRAGSTDRRRSAEVGMSAHIARPIAPQDLLREIERVFGEPEAAAADVPDPWHRDLYEEWVARLGTERMHGFLARLRDQLRDLLLLTLESEGSHEAQHRLAHDVASTAGMLGFLDVTRCCRAAHEATRAGDEAEARRHLIAALECAIVRLDAHLSSTEREPVAA